MQPPDNTAEGIRDILQTAVERAAEALRESEQRMRAILETAVEGIITIDERGIVESMNPAACRIFRYEAAEVIGQNVSMLMPSPDREKHDTYLQNYLRTGHARIIGIGREVVGRRKDGTLFPMDLSVSEVRLHNRRLFTGFVRDISERKQLEQSIAAAAEQERSRIARELHDGLGQQLGGLLFLMDGLQRDLKSANAPQAETARQLGTELSTAVQQARSLAHDLYAVPASPDGLMEALENLAERVETASGIKCVFTCENPVLVHNTAAATHLYRIAQEAVHNAVKHSRATKITINLSVQNAVAELRIDDNGIGFSGQPGSAGLGLRTMEQRAKLISGHLTARAQPNAGVEVICSVPKLIIDTSTAGA